MNRHVIIGNGGAGLAAAKAVRAARPADEVIIISRENCCAYSPVLATHYLAGQISYEDMFSVDEGFYLRNGIQAILDKRVVSIASNTRAVYLDDGGSVAFDTLLIATGSQMIVPPVPGLEGAGTFSLQTAEDAKQIDLWTRRSTSALVMGAGLIGMQVLDALMRRGLRVSLVEKLDQIMPLTLDVEGAAVVQRRLRERGVDLHLGDGATAVANWNGRKVVTLESGSVVEADLVIVATGVRPNVDLAQGSGIQMGRGLFVDECACTNLEGIYAAGDVAEGPDGVLGERLVNATWFNAAEQGRVAGLNMAGIPARCSGNVRMNVSFPLDIEIASVGTVNRTSAEVEEICSLSADHYRKLTFEHGRLVGAVLVGDVQEIGLLTGMIRRQDGNMDLRARLTEDRVLSCFARKFFVSAGSSGAKASRLGTSVRAGGAVIEAATPPSS